MSAEQLLNRPTNVKDIVHLEPKEPGLFDPEKEITPGLELFIMSFYDEHDYNPRNAFNISIIHHPHIIASKDMVMHDTTIFSKELRANGWRRRDELFDAGFYKLINPDMELPDIDESEIETLALGIGASYSFSEMLMHLVILKLIYPDQLSLATRRRFVKRYDTDDEELLLYHDFNLVPMLAHLRLVAPERFEDLISQDIVRERILEAKRSLLVPDRGATKKDQELFQLEGIAALKIIAADEAYIENGRLVINMNSGRKNIPMELPLPAGRKF